MPTDSHVRKLVEGAVYLSKFENYNVSMLFAKGSKFISEALNKSNNKITPIILESYS